MKPTRINLINRQKAIPLNPAGLRVRLERLAALEPLPLSEVNVVLAGERLMARLHAAFLGEPGPTDVITFQHGEIVVCAAVALAEARARRLPPARELLLYAVHGWLHLRGWDDTKPAAARRMAARQEALVRKLWTAGPSLNRACR